MSKIGFSFIAIIVICLSCTRDKMETVDVNSKVLPGVWEVRYSAGGEPAHIETHYAPGNGQLFIFTKDSCYNIYDSVVYSLGAYRIDGTGTNPFTRQQISRITYTNSQSAPFEIKNDTLTFYPDEDMAAWGYVSKYVKIADDTTLPVHP